MYYSPEVSKELPYFLICFNDTIGGFVYVGSNANNILDVIFVADTLKDEIVDLKDVNIYCFWQKNTILKFDKGDKSAKYKQIALRDNEGWKPPKKEIFAEYTVLESGQFFEVLK